jgi:HlyD family secretion protein
VTVEVASVSTDVPVQVFGLGTVGARVQSNVGFKVAGILASLNADSGDRVSAGSVLAGLDAREVAAQLGQAYAGVVQARASLVKANADVTAAEANRANAASVARRRSELAKGGHASVEEAQTTRTAELTAVANLGIANAGVDVADAAVTAAEAQVTYAQAVLDNYTLRAPYDALVVARNLQLGAMPVPGQVVFTLVDPATIWVQSYVDERLAGAIRLGQPAEIVLRSEQDRRHPGHVARIEIQSDAVNEERLVQVAFDDTPRDIHLAEQAEVVFTTGRLDRAALVPQSAVSALRASGGTVWTVEDGKLAKRDVTIGGALLDGRLPIIDRLPDGVQVVISPTSGLRVGRAAVIAEGGSK